MLSIAGYALSPSSLPRLRRYVVRLWYHGGGVYRGECGGRLPPSAPFHQYTNYRLLLLLQPSLPPTTSTTLTRDERRRRGEEEREKSKESRSRWERRGPFFPFPPPSFHTLPQHRCSLPPSGLFPPSPPPFSWDPTAENSFPPFSSTRYYTHTTPLPVYIITRYNGGNDNFAFGTRVCGLSHYADPFRWLPLGRTSFLRRKVFHEVSRWGSQIVPGGARGARTYVDCTA